MHMVWSRSHVIISAHKNFIKSIVPMVSHNIRDANIIVSVTIASHRHRPVLFFFWVVFLWLPTFWIAFAARFRSIYGTVRYDAMRCVLLLYVYAFSSHPVCDTSYAIYIQLFLMIWEFFWAWLLCVRCAPRYISIYMIWFTIWQCSIRIECIFKALNVSR